MLRKSQFLMTFLILIMTLISFQNCSTQTPEGYKTKAGRQPTYCDQQDDCPYDEDDDNDPIDTTNDCPNSNNPNCVVVDKVTFSKTINGGSEVDFDYMTDNIFVKIEASNNLWGCQEYYTTYRDDSNLGHCEDSDNFLEMKQFSDWQYDGTYWRSSAKLFNHNTYIPAQYITYYEDRTNGIQFPPVTFNVINYPVVTSKTPNGDHRRTYSKSNDTLYLRYTSSNQTTKFCFEINDLSGCSNPSALQNGVGGWTHSNGVWRYQTKLSDNIYAAAYSTLAFYFFDGNSAFPKGVKVQINP